MSEMDLEKATHSAAPKNVSYWRLAIALLLAVCISFIVLVQYEIFSMPMLNKPEPYRDEKGGIHVVDPEGKKECVVLWTGHLVQEFVDPSYCYTKEERRTFLRQLVFTFHDLMEGASIEYWIDSGTLLGSYRDKGLILHDIDADVGLTKENFDKLRQTKLNVPSDYELFISDSPHYREGPFDFLPGRFAHKRTGLYVDVFEFLPSEDIIEKTVVETMDFDVVGGKMKMVGNDSNNAIVHWEKDAVVHMVIESKEQHVIEQLGPVTSDAWYACAKCVEYRRFVVPKDWILPLQKCPFDGKEVWCPAKQFEYLDMLYGDSMMTPINPND
ncbi:hypothetical protein THRCLA_07545 [Thraustotheca clavata]|uniref:LicD/FKTN/FKRP nucleotidyltransferase domain-containing protein n=1 Tax=Thraustotheca clavata TaxID=74557 RepID=A0A1V9ZD34_9STRA|nr:hypothetical protein THRCLA_07545 [Thraustotheca clavata]